MIRHQIAIIVSLFALAGCSTTTADLRANPHEKGTLTFAMPYATAFANVANSARTCFPGRGNNAGYYYTTAIEIDPGKLGRVELITIGGGSSMTIASIDVRATETGTELDYFINFRFFGTYDSTSSFRPIASAWAAGDGKKCS